VIRASAATPARRRKDIELGPPRVEWVLGREL
jgi:hypothetical protein